MRKLFQLVGEISIAGINVVEKQLKNIDTNTKKLSYQLAKTGKNFERAGINIAKMTAPLIAVGIASYKAVQLASDLAETISKTGELFGESKEDIEKWASTMAASFGQSKTDAMEAASNFAIFGKAAGYAGKDLVDFSTRFTELASDLASFNNTSPEEAIVAIGAALRGENEPIRRYGVLLNDATMRQKALELGIVDTISKALTPQQKILAASNLIMEQTTAAQGDFARTSDQLANQQRILKAEIKDLATEYGKNYLPIALKIVKILKEDFLPRIKQMVKWFSDLSPELKETIAKITLLAVVIGPLLIVLGKFLQTGRMLYSTIILLNSALLANPFVAAAAAIMAIGGAIYYTVKAWDKWKESIGENVAQQQTSAIKKDLEEIIPLYNELALMDRQPIGEKKFAEVSKKVKELETNLADLGLEFTGSFTKKAEAAENALTDLEMQIKETGDAIDRTPDKIDDVVKSEDDLKKAAEKAKRIEEERIRLSKEMIQQRISETDSIKAQEFQMMKLLDIEEKEALAKVEGGEEAKNTIRELYARKRIQLERETAAKLKEIQDKNLEDDKKREEERAKLLEDKEAKWERIYREAEQQEQEYHNNVMTLFNTIGAAATEFHNYMSQVADNYYQKQFNLLDIQQQKEIEHINQTIQSEKEKENAISAIEKKYDAERRKLRREQAKKDKAIAIFNAIINTAVAVTNALQTQPIWLGIAMAVVMGILGAAQIATIASEPIPMRRGAYIKGGRGGVEAEIGEGVEDEMVLPMKTGVQALAEALINKLNEIKIPEIAAPRLAIAGGGTVTTGGGYAKNGDFHLHIGTLIADETGLKELERRLSPYRVSDQQRKGRAYYGGR